LTVTTQAQKGAAVLFPGALGDFICFLPALLALRARHNGRILLLARPAHLELIRCPELQGASIDRREVSDLFAAGQLDTATRTLLGGYPFAYSWTGFREPHVQARLAAATGGLASVYPFRGMRRGEHAQDYYARCVRARTDLPLADVLRKDEAWLPAFLERHDLEKRTFLLVHPGSGSAAKNWQGFAELADVWRQQHEEHVVVLVGPADDRAVTPTNATVARGLSLPQVAALLSRARVYLGNDSGISHLAGAVGTRGVALFASSDPAIWAPRSASIDVCRTPNVCAMCGDDIFCTHRLPVSAVVEQLQRRLEADTRQHNDSCSPSCGGR
jgi:ADP-heptose:LPS heptosyltransferase